MLTNLLTDYRLFNLPPKLFNCEVTVEFAKNSLIFINSSPSIPQYARRLVCNTWSVCSHAKRQNKGGQATIFA